MRSLLLATTAVLMLTGGASAQIVRVGDTGWSFAVVTISQFTGKSEIVRSTIKRVPFGVFTSQDDCDKARANKIVVLDDNDLRQPHVKPDAPIITTTVTVGNTSRTTEAPGGPMETMHITECIAEKFFAGSQTAQKN